MEGKKVVREVVLCKDCKHRAKYAEGREDDCTGWQQFNEILIKTMNSY